MAETDDARAAKAPALKPENMNPNAELAKKPPSKVREEGELSSSDEDDDENPVCSAVQFAGTVAPPAGHTLIPPVNKGTQGNPAGSIGIQCQASKQPNLKKSSDKNRVPLKSATPGWRPPLGPNSNNLVIRFSDDDSGSDSEDYRQGKAVQTKGNTTVVESNRRLPAPSLAKSNQLRQTAINVNKVMPNKFSLSRAFSSPVPSMQGANSRGAGHSSVDQGSRGRNFNIPNKSLPRGEPRCDKSVGLNNSKLQDLRQQIALRESELRLKSAQQNKESASVSCRVYDVINLNSDTAGKLAATASDSVQLELKEPDKKRLKVNGSLNTPPLNTGSQLEVPVAKSSLPSKGSASDNISLQDWKKVDYSQRGLSVGRAESSIIEWKKQGDRQVAVSSEITPSKAKDGVDTNTGCNQSDRNSRQVNPSVALNPTTPLTNIASNALPKNLSSVELSNLSEIGGHQPPASLLNKSTAQNNFRRGRDHHEVVPSDRTLEPSLNNVCQGSLNDASFWNYLDNANISELGNVSMQSLVEMEESLDKDLEEAQEHRHRCEIEERNALKAYRNAQRAVAKANARCIDLYRKREHYSAHLRSYMMENSRLFSSSMQHEHVGVRLDYSDNMPEDMNLIPMSNHHMQPEFDGFNPGYGSNIHSANNAPTHRQLSGNNLGSEPCSEPDASTSEPLPHRGKNAADTVQCPANDPNISADEDEDTFPYVLECIQPSNESHIKDKNLEDGQNDMNDESSKKNLVDSSQDTLLLEATLRSKLFARLGMRTLSKDISSCDNTEHAVERGAENDVGRDKQQIGSSPYAGAEEHRKSDVGGTDRQERSISEASLEIRMQHQTERFPLNSHSTSDSPDSRLSFRQGHCFPASVSPSSPLILRSAFGHLKVVSSISLIELHARDQRSHYNLIDTQGGACVNSDKIQISNEITNINTIEDFSGREFGSYTCNSAVDPFWPLCMYELRGKCNNDECPWQHVKDYSNGNMYQQQHEDCDSADSEIGLILRHRVCSGATEGPKYADVTTSPTYLVGLDLLRADPRYESVLACGTSQWWEKGFSITLAISNTLQRPFHADGPFLHGSFGRIEIHGNWNRHSSYFQNRHGRLNQLDQAFADNEQSLEMALTILNQEYNKLGGVKKALEVLSRALETDPTSTPLWIFYLLIYYSNTKSVGKDDMFSHAVKHNEGSYELWLMYINSRTQLNDRLVSYDAALKALCNHSPTSDKDRMRASACILDLFLQMMDCLCMSGNVEKAIQRSYGLFPATTNCDEPYSLLLSEILACLTISDKCVVWVCCVYLVIHRKLPDGVVQRFECEKELDVEWPSINLIGDEKQRAVELVEAAFDSVDSHIYTESCKGEINQRSVQLFAVNRINCMMALDSVERVRNLLDKYIKWYPSCLELVLISARMQMHDSGDLSFVGFEDALSNWPKEVPGIQCIWNQYVEYALHSARLDLAKELMVRWFHSIWGVQCLQSRLLESMDCVNSCRSQGLASKSGPETLNSNPSQIDLMFGYLNLSVHRLLQNDHVEAQLAINRAMEAATPGHFKHCLREHAMFLLTDASLKTDDAPITGMKNVLMWYLNSARTLLIPAPLSRKFIDDIKKPRVQQIVNKVFSPVSFDSPLINMVLEVWYGPSLLPQKFGQLKNLVDFVEAILEILPSNYALAISICKLLSRNYDTTNVASAGVWFWASSVLVSAIFHAVPIPPEYVWVEAAGILSNIAGIEAISERFYKRGFSVYPFSVKLWNSYYSVSKTTGNTGTVVKEAKEKGIKLD